MKKIVSIILIFLVLFLATLSINVYAAKLETLNYSVDKQIVHPNETVTLKAEFGTQLGSYTFEISYDTKLLEYVSSEGGDATDLNGKVKLYYYDRTGGSSPRTDMSVTFKAKSDIITSNPTNFSITSEGLASPNAGTRYDDVKDPVIKSITVEPNYEDYSIKLNYTGDVIVNEKKDMEIVIASSMGKNYEHTKIVAEVSGPEGANAKLLATDEESVEHDIIQSEWGSAQGDPLGGKNVTKKLQVRGLFNKIGSYTITLKVIDRDSADKEIAKASFQIAVKEVATKDTTQNGGQTGSTQTTTQKPQNLPKTGNTAYVGIVFAVVILTGAYIMVDKKIK